jgi:predicted AlkP superfamily phosphohydrolase/phosphomutase
MRKLTNSLLGGLLAAFLLTEALLLLNPEVPLDFTTVWRLWGTLALTYGLAAGLFFWLLLIAIEALGGRPLQPAWFSFRLLTWLLMLDLALGAILLWHNLFHFRPYLTNDAIWTIAAAATTLSAAAAILLVLGLFRYSFGRRGAATGYALVLLATSASIVLPFYFRPPRPERAPPVPRLPLADNPLPRRLTVIGIEGASMSYVLPAVAAGRLPNFARLIEGGAAGALRTLYPTESLAIWTSIATGKLPRQHGLIGFYRYRFAGMEPLFSLLPNGLYLRSLERTGLMKRAAVSSAQRRCQTFWTILSSFGVDLGLVRWWATYPAEKVNGFIVSELFHRQVREGFDPELPELTYPPELFEVLKEYVVSPDEIDEVQVARFVDVSEPVPGKSLNWEPDLKRRALADDATYQRIGGMLRAMYDPQVYGIYFFGLDVVSHTFMRYHSPDEFGDVSDAELRKYGRVVDAYYSQLDTILGEHLQSMRPNEILVVMSGHGIEPLPLARRIVESFKGNPHRSGYHDRGPDGLVLFYGSGIEPGAKIQGASVVDITPTLLYLMGLPLGQDMDGRLITDVLEESLVRSQPVAFISSYHNFLIEPRTEGLSYEFPSPLDLLPGVLDESE